MEAVTTWLPQSSAGSFSRREPDYRASVLNATVERVERRPRYQTLHLVSRFSRALWPTGATNPSHRQIGLAHLSAALRRRPLPRQEAARRYFQATSHL
jgi:hypothetical protein